MRRNPARFWNYREAAAFVPERIPARWFMTGEKVALLRVERGPDGYRVSSRSLTFSGIPTVPNASP